ncbi:unnamed protein product, partial [Urochloa humidicola]
HFGASRLLQLQSRQRGSSAAAHSARAPERGGGRGEQAAAMSSRFWRWYADRQFHKWEMTVVWDMVEPYRPPRSFAPLVGTYVAAFYTGVVGAAVTEQLYKEKYWEDHPGEAVPIMPPKFYWGPWRVMNGEVPRFIQPPEEAKTA